MFIFRLSVVNIFLLCLSTLYGINCSQDQPNCDDLLDGQYKCDDPEIDPETQSAKGCSKNHSVEVECELLSGLRCKDQNGKSVTTFKKSIYCRFTSGHSYDTALLLSIFLGMFGIDRFYLGYPAIGLLKFCTLGFFFLFQLIDILLIATQVVGPSDGSNYIIDYYGARLIKVSSNNETYLRPQ